MIPRHTLDSIKAYIHKSGHTILSLARNTISRPALICWLIAASLCSVCDILGFMQSHSFSALFVSGLVFFAITKAFCLALLWTVARKHLASRIVVLVLLIVFFLLSAVNFVSYMGSEIGISRRMFTAMLETNTQAVTEFTPSFIGNILHNLFTFKTIFTGAALILFYVALRRLNRKILLWFFATSVIFGIVFFIGWCKTYQWGRNNYFITVRSAVALRSIIQERKAYDQLSVTCRELPDAETAIASGASPNIIVVIGESASRDHLAIYGYPLPTTPRFSSMTDSLWIFTGANGSSTTTSLNMQRILTFKNDIPDNTEWYDYPALIPLFNHLGYTTVWLSNQERTGMWGNVSGSLSQAADICTYINEYGEDHMLDQYDECLLPHLSKVLESNDTIPVIAFLHLKGSHLSYDLRYPHSQAYLSSSDILRILPRPWLNESKARTIAHYDNSIAYTDSILAEITGMTAHRDRPTIMVYFSDHGENIYDDSDYNGRDHRHLAVPFIIYANAAYRSSHPETVSQIEASLSRRFSTSEICHLLLSLAGANYSYYNPEADIISPSFKPRTIFADDQPLP